MPWTRPEWNQLWTGTKSESGQYPVGGRRLLPEIRGRLFLTIPVYAGRSVGSQHLIFLNLPQRGAPAELRFTRIPDGHDGIAVNAEVRARLTVNYTVVDSNPQANGEIMAKKTVLVSDMSGEEIPEGKGARVESTSSSAKGVRELDLTDSEAERLGGRSVARGRPPKGS